MTKSLTEKIVHIQYELDELFDEYKKIQEQLKDANSIIKDMRPFIQGSMKRETFTRILHYEDKWGIK